MDIYLVLLILILLAGVALLGFLGLVWMIFRRPLPKTKGEQVVEGLRAEAEIVRDRWGVPHVYAGNEADVWFAQGYVHAQDRLFQMDYARRLARGAMAEVLGPAALEADRWSRVLGFWRATEGDLTLLGAEEQAMLDSYAAGVNAYIEAQRYRMPAEFTLAGYKPAPWQPIDSLGILKVLGWALGHNWEGEALRLQLLQALGPERLAEIDPTYPTGHPVSAAGYGGLSAEAAAAAAGDLLAAYRQVSGWLGQHPANGSNNWVLGPGRTASRRPMLANDPHLSVSMPALWYQNHLEAQDGSVQVSGASFAGIPGVVTGHTARVAWGITAGRADTQDLYIEQPDAGQPHRFRYEDGWEEAQVLQESIAVRGADPHVETVVLTRHGPLINGLLRSEAQATAPSLALRWGGHSPSRGMYGMYALQRVHDWASFRAALSAVTDPSQNVVYADVDGNIGYQYVGRVPRRRTGAGVTPVPGWDPAFEWEGWLDFEDLPHAFNPPQGYALSANNRPAGDDYPHHISVDWDQGYRARRIERMVQAKPRFTQRDVQAMQVDVYCVEAESLLPFFLLADGKTLLERRVLRELETWSLHLEVDSFAGAAYEVMRIHLLDLVFGDKLGPLSVGYKGIAASSIFAASAFGGKAALALLRLLEQEESWWFGDQATGQPRTREQVLTVALQRTAVSLNQMIGKDPRKWAWGKVHQVEFAHLFGRGRFLRTVFNRGQFPIGGDEQTVWMTASDLQLPFGLVKVSATYRQVLDVGDWDRSTGLVCPGQSGQPTSIHYADMIDLWREGDQHPLLWTRAAVEAEAEGTLRLLPTGATKVKR